MFILQNIAYAHPNKDLLFQNLNLTINRHDKVALIGNNGVGKSTLLNILAGNLKPSEGRIKAEAKPLYVPQLFGQFNNQSIAQALGVDGKLNALSQILKGNVTEANMLRLNDDWTIEEKCTLALSHWSLESLDLSQPMETLSGGQKTKVFLAGIIIHQPEIVLLDEPTNHLDTLSRNLLYEYISTTNQTVVVVSHDRKLLNLLSTIHELSPKGITTYGGNYEFYRAQKAIEQNAIMETLHAKEKALRKAKDVERESLERQQKLDARGKRKQEKAGVPTIAMNTLRNNAEKSTARLKEIHNEKVGGLYGEVSRMRKELPEKDRIKLGFNDSTLHMGKTLVHAVQINYGFNDRQLWQQPLNFQIISGDRVAIAGVNGSGKTTLIKIILADIQPQSGTIQRADIKSLYIDQEYSLINNSLTVYEQAQEFNKENLLEHEVKSRLTHFLFTKTFWDKHCSSLSGGEKMRLILCCLTLTSHPPEMIILDEPTNNLDIQNLEILTRAINEYEGTIIVVSHDAYFLEQINIKDTVELK